MTDRPAQPHPQIKSLASRRLPLPDTTPEPWSPPPLEQLEDTGLGLLSVSDLVLKALYFGGYMSGQQVADVVKLPFTGVLDRVMDFLKREQFIEVRGAAAGGVSEASFQYLVVGKGLEKAHEALARSQYAAAAPVPLQQYVHAMRQQNRAKTIVHREELLRVTEDLIVADDMLERVGPAVNSGRSIFLYGPPGNGKTTLAERVGRIIFGDDIWIPHAVDVDGQVIRIFDSVNHEISEQFADTKRLATGVVADPRWIRIKRPMIMVGGELTLTGLDLVYDEINKYYEAPFQVKANGGMFLIDDFGRQQVRPRDLLNRWIVPLEKQVDFLTLHNGRKIEVPFHVLIVFSTNLDPRDLVDEAFLRRIRHKIEVGDPTYEQFRDIFRRICEARRIPYNDKGLAYLLNEWYISQERPMRAVHPRDIIAQLVDIATYLNKPPQLTKELLDMAARSYFVDL